MILVTGGTGFLGAYIIRNLVEKGHAVRAMRRSASLPFFIDSGIMEAVEWVEGDVRDTVSLDDAMQGVDSVVHAAAMVSFAKHQREEMYAVNVDGTANVVNAAIENKVRRFLHVSSVAALGRTTEARLVSEEKKWEANKNNTHYAISKQRAEMQVWRGFAEGLEGVIINPSTILGFGNWHQSSCAIFRNAYREFPWYTNGVNGFVGVEDTAEAAVQLLFSAINEKRFIVNSENWSFRRLLETIAENFHKKPPHKEATPALGEMAWRMEGIKSFLTGRQALLTRDTAKIAQSNTSFDNSALLEAVPRFHFTPLEAVIKKACENYRIALEKNELSL